VTSAQVPRRIVVADAQVPFVEGGAALMVRRLVEQLQRRFETALVQVPFRPEVKGNILRQAAAWPLLDLTSAGGQSVDLLIATRFPSYLARHPRKVAWITHQHRAAYDLCGTRFSDFDHVEEDLAIRQRLIELDRAALSECRSVFTIARNTAARLRRFNDVEATPLYHPPPLANRTHEGPFGDYVLAVTRLESVKRAELALAAMEHTPHGIRLVLVGDGSERDTLERQIAERGLSARVQWLRSASEDELANLYAGALAILYAPFDEDYGYVTLEAFLSGKPVITARDSGGTLEFVTHEVTGLVAEPVPPALGRAVGVLAGNRDLAARLGRAGREVASRITWDDVVERLVG
jgi:glycosyltransferase involved in cell wall biosynthesis